MSDETDYLAKKYLDDLHTDAAYTPPTELWPGLFTTVPTSTDGTGAVLVSATANGYGRVKTTAGTWDAATGGGSGTRTKSNAVAITFGPASGASWGTITGVGLYDVSTSAASPNLLMYTSVGTNKSVDDGDSAVFAIGSITFSR